MKDASAARDLLSSRPLALPLRLGAPIHSKGLIATANLVYCIPPGKSTGTRRLVVSLLEALLLSTALPSYPRMIELQRGDSDMKR